VLVRYQSSEKALVAAMDSRAPKPKRPTPRGKAFFPRCVGPFWLQVRDYGFDGLGLLEKVPAAANPPTIPPTAAADTVATTHPGTPPPPFP